MTHFVNLHKPSAVVMDFNTFWHPKKLQFAMCLFLGFYRTTQLC